MADQTQQTAQVAQTAQPQQQATVQSIKSFMTNDNVMARVREVLGKNANAFVTSVLQIVNNNKQLQSADPTSVYSAAMTAATLNLPINNNLQFAHIVPYKDNKRGGIVFAQFQMGWRGFVQLAQRSGELKGISVTDVREGELLNRDRLKGCDFKWVNDDTVRNKLPIIGFVAGMELINGFEKHVYWTVEELKEHARKYSKTYNNSEGKWNTDFEAMCRKTVIKDLLGKYAPLSVDMAKAIETDQSVSTDDGTFYPDNAAESEVVDTEYQDLHKEESKNKSTAAVAEAMNQLKDKTKK